MRFVVKYRDAKSGQVKAERFEAQDRASLWSELKNRGITAISVEKAAEGGAAERKPAVVKGLVAGAVVVCLLAAVVYFFSGEQRPEPVVEQHRKERKPLPPVDPVVNPSPVEEKIIEPPKPAEPERPQRVGETRNGKVLLPNGQYHVVKGVVTSGVSQVTLIDRTFKHGTDCMLAHLLTVSPGASAIGDSESYFRGFEEEFLKTLDDPIVIEEDDDPYVKELKEGVKALRKELLDIKAEGDSIEETLIATRKQMQELSLYKKELEQQVLNMSADDMSQKEYERLVQSANEMLAERGCDPLEMPETIKYAVRLRRFNEAMESKNNEGKEEQE